jgi:hypothetical protein
MNPDGVSYLDVGDALFRHQWTLAINAWWSPLYPWTLGLVLGIVRPSARWEFPLVQAVNFAIFVMALAAFRCLLHALLAWQRRRVRAHPERGEALPEAVLIFLGYAIFLWITLEIVTLYNVTPDILVVGFYALEMAILLRLPERPRMTEFVLLGFVLGLGYWAKTILLPLGFATLGACYLWRRSLAEWRRGLLVAGFVLLLVASPLVLLLSQQKGRITIGDSGKLNYAWYVSPRSFWRNWQGDGDVADSGMPAHSTRRLLKDPPLYEFDGPVAGTYPPWTDPSYWNEGLEWHFALRSQLEVLVGTVSSELRVLLRSRPELVAGVAVLALLGGRLWLMELMDLWPPLVLSLLGMSLYLPLVEHDRYLGGYVLVLFVLSLAAVRLRLPLQKSGFYVALVAGIVMLIGTADYTVRILTSHYAIPGVGPTDNWHDVVAAEELADTGIGPGDKVAIIGDGTAAYWARLGKLRIVAEIMDAFHGSTEFWNAPEEQQQQVYAAFRRTQAKAIVAKCPVCPARALAGWHSMAGTPYCYRRLP